MKNNIWNEDCIVGMANRLQEASIDLCVTSIPFGALFIYSGKPEDIGNNADGVDMRAGQFGLHMRFFVEQLARVMKPGRNVCIHITQMRAVKVLHGYMGRRDFRGAIVDIFSSGGFEYAGEFAITKNPQAMSIRLHLHSLMFETGKRNAVMLSPAPNDYVLIFRKPGDAAERVRAIYDGQDNPKGWITTEDWIKWADGVWTDIRETDVLKFTDARDENDEKHVCPLQLEVIRRLIRLYTNPGELVLDPFMGIGSTAFVAKEQGRDAVGFELKESYYNLAIRNLAQQEKQLTEDKHDLFSLCQTPTGTDVSAAS